MNHEGHEGSRRILFRVFSSCDFVPFVLTIFQAQARGTRRYSCSVLDWPLAFPA